MVTPGISTGYWNARNTPLAARSSGSSSSRSLALEQDLAAGHLITGACRRGCRLSVDLPEPFGPMMACTSPAIHGQVSPGGSLASIRTCRFFTSSIAVISTPSSARLMRRWHTSFDLPSNALETSPVLRRRCIDSMSRPNASNRTGIFNRRAAIPHDATTSCARSARSPRSARPRL